MSIHSSQFETRADSDQDDQSLEGLRLQRAVEARLFDAEPEPLRVGRFVIVDGIGEGAMGVVYRAFDPELGRPVALKLSQSRVELGGLMMQEAQALARLSHPNVVTIHEVGTHAGRLFLAMELVEGLPLHRWCERHRSSGSRWAARVEGLLEQAAEGLRAAHEAGVVHRDLKPSNILVGDDGRLRLVDFGLARTAVVGAEDSSASHDDEVVGTPAYMAPEQFDGRADELSDEFGLCSTFFEVLYGVRAHTGADRRELEENLRAGRMTEPPSRAGPGYLHHVLRKGLARDPVDRHGGADALLHALGRGRTRRWGLRSGVAGIVAAVVIGGLGWSYSAGRVQPCRGARAQLAGAWDLPRREEVEQAMRTSAVPYAITTWERIAPRVDAYADAWVQQHTSACEATAVHEAQSADVLDRRMGCLHRAKVELGAVSGQLVAADASTVEYAHRMVDELPPLRHCADVERLLADVAPPEAEEVEAVGALRVQLAEGRALRLAGLYEDAVAHLEALREDSESLDYAPVRTELSMELGQALGRASRYEDAERYLIEALRAALSQGQWSIAIDVASELMFIVGERADRPQEALAYGQTAWGLIERAPDPVAESELWAHQASIFSKRGEFGTAERQLRRAFAMVEPILPSSHYRLGMLHNQLGNVLSKQKRLDEAEAELRVALERFVEGQGPTHPYVGGVHANLAGVLKEQGKLAEAEAEARHGQRIWLEVLGPDHLNLAMSHLGLGNILRRLERLEDAEDEYRRAQRVYGEVLGPENRRTLGAGMNLALVLLDQGEYEASEAQSRDLIPRVVKAVGPRHSMVADAHTNLGNALFEQGRYEDAEVEHRRAVEVYESVPEPSGDSLAVAYANVSVALRHLGRLDEAEAQRRRALKLELEVFGAEHPRVITSRERLASIEQERGEAAVPAPDPTIRRTE